jgi:hypothetical protein
MINNEFIDDGPNKSKKLNFWDIIHEFDKFLLECSGSIKRCSPSFDLKHFSISDPEIEIGRANV